MLSIYSIWEIYYSSYTFCVCVSDLFIKEKRRLAIRNAAQQWEGVKTCLEPPPTNGSKEDASPENSPGHSPAQTNGLAQETSPEEPRCIMYGVFLISPVFWELLEPLFHQNNSACQFSIIYHVAITNFNVFSCETM